MAQKLFDDLLKAIGTVPIVDIHTHVPFRRPVAEDAWDILGYHYFTEQAHTQGMDASVADPATRMSRKKSTLPRRFAEK